MACNNRPAAAWHTLCIFAFALLVYGNASPVAARPTAAAALRLKPTQDVKYDVPDEKEQEKCELEAAKGEQGSGWIVLGPAGETLRRFLDTNGDNKVDLWAYYQNGLECYRDVDSDFDGRADSFRWLGPAGSRWAIDSDGDGEPDRWKWISAAEVTSELVAALAEQDAGRFARLLPSDAELADLGLSPAAEKELAAQIRATRARFTNIVGTQSVVGSQTQWLNFGAGLPAVLAEGADGRTRDVMVYENVTAVTETGGRHGQLYVGTLVKTSGGWRLVKLPEDLSTGDQMQPAFLQASVRSVAPEAPATPESGLSEQEQKLLSQLERLDQQLVSANDAQREQIHGQRADVLLDLAAEADDKQTQANWIRQLADQLSAAAQAGEYRDGVRRLTKLDEQMAEKSGAGELTAYVRYRRMSAEYAASLREPEADYAKIQGNWLEQLEGFVSDFPDSPDAADAMLQLALAEEFAGKEKAAQDWYERIVRQFRRLPIADKAAGALKRLDSVGKPFALRGTMLHNGKPLDIGAYRGKLVIVHYWATWCGPCKQDMQQLAGLLRDYRRNGLEVVGVNLDNQADAAKAYVAQARVTWPQVFDEAGLDGPLATELGVLTLPTMFLVGPDGRVIHRALTIGEAESEIKRALKR